MRQLANVILAHQGGWDEILLFAAPVILAVWAVRRVERRGRRPDDEPEAETQPEERSDSQPTEAD